MSFGPRSASGWLAWFAMAWLSSATVTTAASKEERWLKLTTPEFTVITSLKEKEASAWAGEFAQFIAAMRGYFMQGNRKLAPLTVVIFARERDFAGYRPTNPDGTPQDVAGFFARRETWAVAGLAGTNESEDLRRTIFHEGTHWFMSSTQQQQPVWLEEGLAEVFSTFKMEKGKATWGRAIDEHVFLLHHSTPLPLVRLLAVGKGELFHGTSLQTGVIYAESWAFVHYLIFGKHKISRKALSDYVDLSRTAIDPEEAFRRAFGRTLSEMDREFRQYFEGGAYYVSRQPMALVEPPQIAPASTAEVANALGRLALSAQRKELAENHARAAIAAAADAPAGYELLGAVLKLKGDEPGARDAFAMAAGKGSRDFEPYFELAVAEQNAAANEHNRIDALPPASARRIANRYERAINLHPRFLTSYQNLAGIINLAEPVSDADRDFLELGQKFYPDDCMIKLGLAVLAKKLGDGTKARALLDEVLAVPAQPSTVRGFAANLDHAWEQQEIFERVEGLAKAGNFTEAANFIGERLERGVQPTLRPQLVEQRKQLRADARGSEIKKALDERRWADARPLLDDLLGSDAPAFLKKQARRTLDDLDRQKLGMPKNPP